MRETVAAAAAVAFALLIGVPALAVDDVLGWQDFRWGMSESQALKVAEISGLRVERRDTSKSYDGFCVPFESAITLHEASFTVRFLFLRDTRALGRILMFSLDLFPQSSIRPGEPSPRGMLLEPVHAQVRQTLIEKYGTPKLDPPVSENFAPDAVWAFATTTIKLLGVIRTPRNWPVMITYRPTAAPPKKDEKEKL
jgi:hypothetical protein